jgi:hypothetical protein
MTRSQSVLFIASVLIISTACAPSPVAPSRQGAVMGGTTTAPPPVDGPSPTPQADPATTPAPAPPVPVPPVPPHEDVVGTLTITAIAGDALGPLYHAGDTFQFSLRASGSTAVLDWALCDGPVSWKTDKWVGDCRHAPPMLGEWYIEVRGRSVELSGRHPLGSVVTIAGEVR